MGTGPAVDMRVSIVGRYMACELANEHTFSVAENWVAVIISCMPAVASVFHIYIGQSQLFTYLQARILNRSRDSSNTPKKHFAERNLSRSGSQKVSNPLSSSTTGPYYRLEERVPVSNAQYITIQDLESRGVAVHI